jgi:hypothetical protein
MKVLIGCGVCLLGVGWLVYLFYQNSQIQYKFSTYEPAYDALTLVQEDGKRVRVSDACSPHAQHWWHLAIPYRRHVREECQSLFDGEKQRAQIELYRKCEARNIPMEHCTYEVLRAALQSRE